MTSGMIIIPYEIKQLNFYIMYAVYKIVAFHMDFFPTSLCYLPLTQPPSYQGKPFKEYNIGV